MRIAAGETIALLFELARDMDSVSLKPFAMINILDAVSPIVKCSYQDKTLKHFGFGSKFIKIIDTIYNGINSSVSLPQGTTKRFEVKRGIRQGCPCSPLLFILVAELLAIYIKNSTEIEPLYVLGHHLSITQLADDTAVFIKQSEQIPLIITKVEKFSKASGLYLN